MRGPAGLNLLEFCLCDYHSILRPHNIIMAHSNIETRPWSELKPIYLTPYSTNLSTSMFSHFFQEATGVQGR